MKVPFLDLKAQYREIKIEIRQEIDQVLESQAFILGTGVRRFEERVASYLTCRHAIGVASGSDALLLSLMVLGVGPGDGVLVPSFTFFATASCIVRLGATPVFVDVDPQSCLIAPSEVELLLEKGCQPSPSGEGTLHRRSKSRLKVLIPVHLFGQSCSMSDLCSLAERHRLRIVEDAAQAFGCQASLNQGGTLGDLGCFSFFPSKTLGGIGDGGLVVTNQDDLAAEVRRLRVHGQDSCYHHEAVGINSRLDVIQAAVLQVKLRYLDRWINERIRCAETYHRLFSETGLVGERVLSLPASGNGKRHIFNYYVIRVQQRDPLKNYLAELGIETQVYYPVPLHLQPCFDYLGYRSGDFPNAELIASQALALPIYPELTTKHQETVVQGIADYFHK